MLCTSVPFDHSPMYPFRGMNPAHLDTPHLRYRESWITGKLAANVEKLMMKIESIIIILCI
jgi:hypothetical protein